MSDICDEKCVHPMAVKAASESLPKSEELSACADFFKMFSDPTRLTLLNALRGGELCVCDLAAVSLLSDSAVSHQLALLRRSFLVSTRRAGKIVYYKLADSHVETILDFAIEHLREGV